MKTNRILLIAIGILIVCLGAIFAFNGKNAEEKQENRWEENILKVVEVYAFEEEYENFGTAFFVDEKVLATNYHVVSRLISGERSTFDNIQVRFYDEEEYTAVSLISYDEAEDVVFLRYDGEHIYEKFTASGEAAAGEPCFTIGNYANYGLSYKAGAVGLSSVKMTYNDSESEYVMLSVNIGQGDSGAPVFNSKNELIGMITFRSKGGGTYVEQGFAYAIPAEKIIKMAGK